MAQTPKSDIEKVSLEVRTKGIKSAENAMWKLQGAVETTELGVELLNEEFDKLPSSVKKAATQIDSLGLSSDKSVLALRDISEVLSDEFDDTKQAIGRTNDLLENMSHQLGVMANEADYTAGAMDALVDNTKDFDKIVGSTTKEIEDYNKQVQRTRKGVEGLSRANSSAGKNMSKISKESNAVVQTYAKIAANVYAIGAALRFVQQGDQLQKMNKALVGLSEQKGENLFAVSEAMMSASEGAIDMRTSLEAAAKSGIFEFSSKEMATMTKVAMGASDTMGMALPEAMERLTKGISLVQPELLNNLGILIRIDEVMRNYAISVGKTASQLSTSERAQAVKEAVLQSKAAILLAKQGESGLSAIEKLTGNIKTAWQELLEAVSGSMNTLLTTVGPSLVSIFDRLNTSITGVSKEGRALFRTTDELERSANGLKTAQELLEGGGIADMERFNKSVLRVSDSTQTLQDKLRSVTDELSRVREEGDRRSSAAMLGDAELSQLFKDKTGKLPSKDALEDFRSTLFALADKALAKEKLLVLEQQKGRDILAERGDLRESEVVRARELVGATRNIKANLTEIPKLMEAFRSKDTQEELLGGYVDNLTRDLQYAKSLAADATAGSAAQLKILEQEERALKGQLEARGMLKGTLEETARFWSSAGRALLDTQRDMAINAQRNAQTQEDQLAIDTDSIRIQMQLLDIKRASLVLGDEAGQRQIELLEAQIAKQKEMLELQKQRADVFTKMTADQNSSFETLMGLGTLGDSLGGDAGQQMAANTSMMAESISRLGEFAPGVQELSQAITGLGMTFKGLGEGSVDMTESISTGLAFTSKAMSGLMSMQAKAHQNRISQAKARGASDKEVEKMERKHFERNKKMQMGMVVMDTASAAMKAISQFGMPWGLIPAGMATAMGAMSLANISSTTFEGGGSSSDAGQASLTVGGQGQGSFDVANMDDGDYGAFTGDSTIGNPNSYLNDISATGSSVASSSSGNNVNIYAMDSQSFTDFAMNNREGLSTAVDASLGETHGTSFDVLSGT